MQEVTPERIAAALKVGDRIPKIEIRTKSKLWKSVEKLLRNRDMLITEDEQYFRVTSSYRGR